MTTPYWVVVYRDHSDVPDHGASVYTDWGGMIQDVADYDSRKLSHDVLDVLELSRHGELQAITSDMDRSVKETLDDWDAEWDHLQSLRNVK